MTWRAKNATLPVATLHFVNIASHGSTVTTIVQAASLEPLVTLRLAIVEYA